MTGAATFETHIDINKASDIFVNKIIFGFVPTDDRICVEMILAILNFDKAAAKVKPPNSNIMTLDHIVERINCDDWIGVSTLVGSVGSDNTGNTTINKGISNEVTNNGIVSVAHKIDAYIKIEKQFFSK